MEFGGRHLAALCREIVTLALRSREQQRGLDDHAERLALLEAEVGDLVDERASAQRPPPLEIARPSEASRSDAVDSLTQSFETRLGSSDEERP
jgi:hypothetical protein